MKILNGHLLPPSGRLLNWSVSRGRIKKIKSKLILFHGKPDEIFHGPQVGHDTEVGNHCPKSFLFVISKLLSSSAQTLPLPGLRSRGRPCRASTGPVASCPQWAAGSQACPSPPWSSGTAPPSSAFRAPHPSRRVERLCLRPVRRKRRRSLGWVSGKEKNTINRD